MSERRGQGGVFRRIAAALIAVWVIAAIAACSREQAPSDAANAKRVASGPVFTPWPKPSPRPTPARAAAADIVIRHGRIFSSNAAQPWIVSVAVKDGKIVAVGSNSDVNPWIGEGTRVIDLHLDFVMAGMVLPAPASGASGGESARTAGGEPADAVAALSPPEAWESIQKVMAARAQQAEREGRTVGSVGAASVPEHDDTLAKLLRAWTIENARANGRAAEVGSLEVGKRANILILDRHPYFAKPETLAETRALFVVSDGKIVRDELATRKTSPPAP